MHSNERFDMSHRWKMTVMALDSITHRYCLVFREQSVAFCRGAGRETSDGCFSCPVLSISGESPVIFREVSTVHVLCYLFRPWCDVESVGSGGAADCVSAGRGGVEAVQAAMNASPPLTTHNSGSQPGGRGPHKGPLDKPGGVAG